MGPSECRCKEIDVQATSAYAPKLGHNRASLSGRWILRFSGPRDTPLFPCVSEMRESNCIIGNLSELDSGCCRLYTCIKALLFGEDFALDPVTKSLRLGLRLFSGGHIDVDVQSFSQVSAVGLLFWALYHVMEQQAVCCAQELDERASHSA